MSDDQPTVIIIDDEPDLADLYAAWLDDEGFAWFSLMDHLWQLSGNGQRDGPFLDAYTALPAVAGSAV